MISALSSFLEGENNSEYICFQEGHEDPIDGSKELFLSFNGQHDFCLSTSTMEVSATNRALSAWCDRVNSRVAIKRPNVRLTDVLTIGTEIYRELGLGVEEEDDCGNFADEDLFEHPTSVPEKSSADAEFSAYMQKYESLGLITNKQAASRIFADIRQLWKCGNEFGFRAEPRPDDLYRWDVKLFNFEKGTGLYNDMLEYAKRTGKDFVEFCMEFPADYPFSPPFIRAIRPRFTFHTGHITIGGSICMELLTKTGWTAANSVESILVQIRTEIVLGGGRLDLSNTTDYTEQEAKAAFVRVAEQHGWKQ